MPTPELLLKAAAKAELLIRKCAAVVEFIRLSVWIEDKTVPGNVSKFVLWPAQVKALLDILVHRLVVIVKARQLGLTWLVLAYAVWRMVFNHGFTVVALSRSEPDAIELVDYRLAKILMPRLPKWMIRPKSEAPAAWQGPVWYANKHELTIEHWAPPGEVKPPPSRFKADAAAADSGRSITANLVIFDEWAFQIWAEEIWSAGYPTINRPGATVFDGQVIGLSSGKAATFFERVVRDAPGNGFHLIFLPWQADPRRDIDWYDATKRAMPTRYRREYPATLDDAFSGGDQTAFPNFSPKPGAGYVVKPFEVPRWWKRWRSVDPGIGDQHAWYWYAAAPDGRVVIYKEMARGPDDPRLLHSEQADRASVLSIYGAEVGRPAQDEETGQWVYEKTAFTAAGWDAFRVDPEVGKAIVHYYAENGIGDCLEAPKDKASRYSTVSEYMKVADWGESETSKLLGQQTAQVVIFSTCKWLIESLPLLVTDEKKPDIVAAHKLDHYYDSVGYGLQTWHPEESKEPTPPKTRVQSHKEKLARAIKAVQRGAY